MLADKKNAVVFSILEMSKRIASDSDSDFQGSDPRCSSGPERVGNASESEDDIVLEDDIVSTEDSDSDDAYSENEKPRVSKKKAPAAATKVPKKSAAPSIAKKGPVALKKSSASGAAAKKKAPATKATSKTPISKGAAVSKSASACVPGGGVQIPEAFKSPVPLRVGLSKRAHIKENLHPYL